MSCLVLSLPTYLSNLMVSSTQTLAQIKSNEVVGHIKQYFMTTSPFRYVTNGIQDFVKCHIKCWVPLDLRPNKMLFGRLQLKATYNNICKRYCRLYFNLLTRTYTLRLCINRALKEIFQFVTQIPVFYRCKTNLHEMVIQKLTFIVFP